MRARRPRLPALVAAALVLLAGLALLGRWERDRNAAAQNHAMRSVYDVATSRGLDSTLLDAYRLDMQFDCLLYHPVGRPQDVAAYELCFDPHGRLVQTIDRHTGSPTFATLHEQPSLAAVRVPVHRLMAIFAARGVLATDPRFAGVGSDAPALPLVNGDTGAFAFPKPPPG